MAKIKELIKIVSHTFELPEDVSLKLFDILIDNWFDTPRLISSASPESLVSIGIPSNIVEGLLKEATKLNDFISENSRSSFSKKYKRYNFDISPNIEVSSDNQIVEASSSGQQEPYEKLINDYLSYQTNKEVQKESLKKIKFCLSRIKSSPDNQAFKLVNIKDPENHNYIFRYASLTELYTYLGFTYFNSSCICLESNGFDLNKLSKTLEFIKNKQKVYQSEMIIETDETPSKDDNMTPEDCLNRIKHEFIGLFQPVCVKKNMNDIISNSTVQEYYFQDNRNFDNKFSKDELVFDMFETVSKRREDIKLQKQMDINAKIGNVLNSSKKAKVRTEWIQLQSKILTKIQNTDQHFSRTASNKKNIDKLEAYVIEDNCVFLVFYSEKELLEIKINKTCTISELHDVIQVNLGLEAIEYELRLEFTKEKFDDKIEGLMFFELENQNVYILKLIRKKITSDKYSQVLNMRFDWLLS